MGIFLRIFVNAVAIMAVGALFSGIEVNNIFSALLAGLFLGVINGLVRPILVLLTLPLTFFTLGFFLLVLNAFCFWITAGLVPGVEIHGFWTALFGALFVSLISFFLNGFIHDQGRVETISVNYREIK